MTGVRICAITPAGQEAMRRVNDEAGSDEAALKRLGFIERVENDSPFRVFIEARGKLAKKFGVDRMCSLIEKQMHSLNCVRGIDYDLEVLP